MSINVAQYQIPRYLNVTFATYDGSSMNFGLREPGTISRRGMTVNSVQFPVADLHGYDVALTGRQTRIVDFVNLYTLVSSGPHQMVANTASGQALAFTDNTATFASPNGSALLGGNVSYVIGQTERQIDYKGHTMMAQTETNWMLTSSPTTPVGGSGTELPYAGVYNRGAFVRRGIAYIQVNGIKYNIFSGSRFSAVTREADGDAGKDFRERPYPSMLKTDFTSNILCTDATSLANLNTAEQLSPAIVIGTWADETITWNSGASSVWVENLGQSERGFMAQIHVSADLPMINAAVAFGATSMTFSLAQ